jgi:hypothetical protein
MNNYIFKSATELSSLIRNKEATSTAIVKPNGIQLLPKKPNSDKMCEMEIFEPKNIA